MPFIEYEEKGVTILNNIDSFCAKEGLRSRRCLIKFEYPKSSGAEWSLQFNVNSDQTEKIDVYLTRTYNPFNEKIDLSGTYSVVTSDGKCHILGEFLNYTFHENGGVKPVLLKELNKVACDREYVCPNGTLTLRCHLWSGSIKDCDLIYYATSKCETKKIKIPFFMKVDSIRNRIVFRSCLRKVLLREMFPSEEHRLNLMLTFENFLSPVTICTLNITKPAADFDFSFTFKLVAKASNDMFLTLVPKNPYYHHILVGDSSFETSFPVYISEILEKQDLFYPEGILTLYCGIKLIRSCTLVETFDLNLETKSLQTEESKNQFLLDSIMSKMTVSIQNLEDFPEEDEEFFDEIENYTIYEYTPKIEDASASKDDSVNGSRISEKISKFEEITINGSEISEEITELEQDLLEESPNMHRVTRF